MAKCLYQTEEIWENNGEMKCEPIRKFDGGLDALGVTTPHLQTANNQSLTIKAEEQKDNLWSIPHEIILEPSMLKSALSTSSLEKDVNQTFPRFEKLPLPVTLHSSKNGDIVLGFDIPQPEERYLSFYQFNKKSTKSNIICFYLRAWSLETERSRFGSFGWNFSSLIALPENLEMKVGNSWTSRKYLQKRRFRMT